jgi:hypothetical protein
MRILVIGDIFGKPGRLAVVQLLPELRQELALDLVIANAENLAGGRGLNARGLDELRRAGVDVFTSGNHVWDQKETREFIEQRDDVLRPINYPPNVPGRGCWLRNGVLVINAMGRLFMRAIDCPFRAVDRALEEAGEMARVRIVDFHGEATSEKVAMAWYFDGRVSAVVGTHTHVPSADPRILAGGTAALTDIGMVGPYNSIIGMDPRIVLDGFLTAMPQKFTVGPGPRAQFNSVLVDVDEETGHARSIERVDRLVNVEV